MKTTNNSRRSFIKWSGLLSAGIITGLQANALGFETNPSQHKLENLQQDDGAFQLPALPYTYDALEPYIDAKTMEIHYSKHHAAYVNKLNEAIAGSMEYQGKTLEELFNSLEKMTSTLQKAVRNQGGGHWNHSFFWTILSSGSKPFKGKVADAIVSQYGGYDEFKKLFNDSAMKVFGSGWCWLIKDTQGKLNIVNMPNQDNPLMSLAEIKGKPLMGVDVWEHAYYLKHQNKRADYLNDIWNIWNWEKIEQNYLSA
jgi:Fe-Mn family superoxide dismutase